MISKLKIEIAHLLHDRPFTRECNLRILPDIHLFGVFAFGPDDLNSGVVGTQLIAVLQLGGDFEWDLLIPPCCGGFSGFCDGDPAPSGVLDH